MVVIGNVVVVVLEVDVVDVATVVDVDVGVGEFVAGRTVTTVVVAGIVVVVLACDVVVVVAAPASVVDCFGLAARTMTEETASAAMTVNAHELHSDKRRFMRYDLPCPTPTSQSHDNAHEDEKSVSGIELCNI